MDEDGVGRDVDVILSPGNAAKDSKLHLPPSTDPPGPQNPPKQLVWVVSFVFALMERDSCLLNTVSDIWRDRAHGPDPRPHCSCT